ncbi:hypothetical protein D3227_38100 [Mesorhizobium waimense]|uniref:Uncharacterized protein n=1 Tax=Mesorhizobium waimense TaxID=1300307 RepID=A0A3A5JSR9_9HYPH|nr:hypothetical protein D3227_38100 [Mesorhizobium waimense]
MLNPREITGLPRPATFDSRQTFRLLADLLARRGLDKAHLGTEHAFLPVADAPSFAGACPKARWSDASGIVSMLRMVKSPQEIAKLTLGGHAAEAGVHAILSELKVGVTPQELWDVYCRAAAVEVDRHGAQGLFCTDRNHHRRAVRDGTWPAGRTW